jgi:hypothetical protein
MVFVRNPQIRWTFWDKNGWKAVALEHATNDIDTGNLRLIDERPHRTSGMTKGPGPHSSGPPLGKGTCAACRILRRVGYDTIGTENNEPKGHKTGWGVDFTGSFKVALATFRLGAVSDGASGHT